MNYTTQLFAKPYFLKGAARIIDLGGTINVYNSSDSGIDADFNAIESDWNAVGEDLNKTFKAYEQKQKNKQTK